MSLPWAGNSTSLNLHQQHKRNWCKHVQLKPHFYKKRWVISGSAPAIRNIISTKEFSNQQWIFKPIEGNRLLKRINHWLDVQTAGASVKKRLMSRDQPGKLGQLLPNHIFHFWHIKTSHLKTQYYCQRKKIMAATLALKMLNFYLVSPSLYTFSVYSQVFIILFTWNELALD